MTQVQHTDRNHGYFRPGQRFCIITILGVLAATCQAQENRPTVVRPPVAQPHEAKQQLKEQLTNLKAMAPSSVLDTDPDLCPTPNSPDPKENSIGGLNSLSVYQFSSQTHLQNLYARLVLLMKICTGNTLSSNDEKALEKALNFLQITKARSFAATVSLTGDGQGGVTYPQVVPFSYSYDEKTKTYSVQTITDGVIPWQVTSAFEVQYSYNANQNLSINTATLFSNIVTAVAGGGGTTALLSPAANAYLAAGQTVLQDLSQAFFTQVTNSKNSQHLDLLQGPAGALPDRALTYRFRDLSNPPRPLAAVRLVVSFTNSIARPDPVDPTTDDSTHVPHFDQLQPILNVAVGGPSGGQTLLQQISKEQSYQDLLKSTADTTPASFRSSCNTLEGVLTTNYGLNEYDNALAMGEILSQNTLYLSLQKFYTSGCFQNRGVLKTMGIMDFEHAPSS